MSNESTQVEENKALQPVPDIIGNVSEAEAKAIEKERVRQILLARTKGDCPCKRKRLEEEQHESVATVRSDRWSDSPGVGAGPDYTGTVVITVCMCLVVVACTFFNKRGEK